MTNTLILIFHPNLKTSTANAAMAASANTQPGVESVDMTALYPDGTIDTNREVARLLSAQRIVLQFPVYWYSTPPLLKAWQDAVLTRMFYVNYETEGKRLEGTPLCVAATAGNASSAYTPEGPNLFSLETLLRPLEATAHRCRLPWAKPFLVYRANRLEADERSHLAAAYVEHLDAWTKATPTIRS